MKKICDVKGIKAAGIKAGIKQSGKKDLALIVSDMPGNAAGVFTSNKVKAASVIISQRHLQSEKIKAVIMSSGNANAATGKKGLDAAYAMCKEAADFLKCKPEEILIAQTGLIGINLDKEIAVKGVAKACREINNTSSDSAAEAIMTTDTKPKHASEVIFIDNKEIVIAGIAKGAAMLSPSMATMLATVVTDLSIGKDVIDYALRAVMSDSFHAMVVDGCRSTNDTVFLLANGAAGNNTIDSISHPEYKKFENALFNVCKSLAKQMAADAEGATKFLIMKVKGAVNKEEARIAARGVVSSTLVKCSLAGETTYWGRVISELGASGADFNPDDVEIKYGEITICKNGQACEHDEHAADKYVKQRDIVITAIIGTGSGEAEAYGCDLTHAYVDENMGKS